MNSDSAYTTDYNPGFPFYCFDYDIHNECNNIDQEIEDEEFLKAVFNHQVMRALQEKRKLIIVDVFGYCLLHVEGGEIIFPLREHLKNLDTTFILRNGRFHSIE